MIHVFFFFFESKIFFPRPLTVYVRINRNTLKISGWGSQVQFKVGVYVLEGVSIVLH